MATRRGFGSSHRPQSTSPAARASTACFTLYYHHVQLPQVPQLPLHRPISALSPSKCLLRLNSPRCRRRLWNSIKIPRANVYSQPCFLPRDRSRVNNHVSTDTGLLELTNGTCSSRRRKNPSSCRLLSDVDA